MKFKLKLRTSSFEATDMMIMLGIGAVLGGLMGFGGVIIGILIVAGAWAITKLEKKEAKPVEK